MLSVIQKSQFERFMTALQIPLEMMSSICYTDPDNEQICLKLSNDSFLYSQRDEDNVLIAEPYRTEIMLWEDFNTEELQKEAISGYYSSINEVKKIYGESWKMIVLECAFEQEL